MNSDNVKKFRKKKCLTQDGLAKKADIPYTTLTKLESNVFKKFSVNKKSRYILPNWDYISTFSERYRGNMSTCRHTYTLGGILTEYREAKK